VLNSDGLRICIFRNVAELEGLRESWKSWPGNRDSEIDSFVQFIDSNKETIRPHVLAVYRDGRPDAILAGRLDHSRIICRLGYLHVKPRARILCFVYGAFRGNQSNENCEIVLDSILRSLSEGEADVAYMNFMKEDSKLCELAKKRPGLLSRDYLRVKQLHFTATLPATVDEFYKRLSSGARWQAKNRERKIQRDFGGDVRVRCFRAPSEIGEMIQHVEEIAKKTYQRGLGIGFVDKPETRQHLLLKAERGWLRGYVLYIVGKPSAFWIGDVNETTFGSDYLGYDPAFAKYSPGMYLIMRVIEGFCDGRREGISAIDFATGAAQYKEILSTEAWREMSVYIFAPTLKGLALNFVRTLIGGVDRTLKKTLARAKLLQKVKKAWRSHSVPEAIRET
jgi:hypothetical protein